LSSSEDIPVEDDDAEQEGVSKMAHSATEKKLNNNDGGHA
jgi:hypothetical protein